jgi:hypothetical protein
MASRRILIAAAAGLAVAGGAAGAVAATRADDERDVIERAAQQLRVSPEALRDALGDAQDAELDDAVREGRLTQEQADALKARRRQSGRVLGALGGRGHHRDGPRGGRGLVRGVLGDAAQALGITREQLHDRLHAGETLAAIAKAEGKSLADVKAAVRRAVETRLDAEVRAGRLADARRDALLARFDEHFDRLATQGLPRRGHR